MRSHCSGASIATRRVLLPVFLTCLIALSFGASPAQALSTSGDGSWFWLSPAPTGAYAWRTSWITQQEGWAVGTNDGVVLHTVNGGATWTPQLVVRGAWFFDLRFVDRFDGWVVSSATDPVTQTETATLYRTTDGGVSWTSVEHPSQPYYNAVERSGKKTGWVVGRSGYVARTTDGGTSWISQVSDTAQSLNDVSFVDAVHGVAVGNNGATTMTTDGGGVWQSATVAGSPRLAAVDMVDAEHGWASGNNGVIVVTSDGGTSWIPQSSGTTKGLSDIDFASLTVGWAVGQDGTVLRTTDGGQSWPAVALGTAEEIFTVKTFGANVAQIGGDRGWTVRTTDAGATWQPLPSSATTTDLDAVDFVSPLLGWTVGAAGTIMRSTDGGASWAAQAAPTSQPLDAVDFVDAQNGWVGGYYGALVRTTNGGETWLAPLVVPSASSYRDLCFVGPGTGWVLSLNRQIHRTTDAGATWQSQDSGLTGSEFLFSIDCTDALNAWAVGSEGAIVHTTDGGATDWVKQTSPVVGAQFQSVDFVDDDRGWAVGAWNDPTPPGVDWSLIVATTDGGDTWSAQYFEPGRSLKSVAMGDALTGWAVDWIGAPLQTTDGGATWAPRVSGMSSETGGLCALDAGHAWMVGRFGSVLTTASGDTTAPVVKATGAASGWYRSKRTLTFSATDAGASATGIQSIDYQVDGGIWTKGARLTVAAPTSHANDGRHVILYRATDWAGNVSTTKKLTIGIDTRRPKTVAPYGASAYAGRRATLRFKVVDAKPNGATAKVVVRIRNSRGTTVKTLRFGSCTVNKRVSRTWSCTLPRGTYRFVVYATDRAGNKQSSTGSNRLTVR